MWSRRYELGKERPSANECAGRGSKGQANGESKREGEGTDKTQIGMGTGAKRQKHLTFINEHGPRVPSRYRRKD